MERTQASTLEHVYALQALLYQQDETPMSYVQLTDTLELRGGVSLDGANEFPGYAFISSIGKKLLLSSGEAPEITQYSIGKNGSWNERARLNFANLGVPTFGAGFERHWFLNGHAAYITHEVTSRIVWDPTEMTIVEVKEDTNLAREREGLTLDATFNRPPLVFEGPVLKPFYYRDDDWFEFGGTTPIAVYDPNTHEERKIIEVPCPALEVMSQDEDGNTYFSPWSYGPALALFGEGPKPCIRRITSKSTLDENWAPELSEWTDGRPVHVLRYVRDGKALGTVLHVDEVEGDFSSGYDEALATELDVHWRLWEFNLLAETARLIEEIPTTGSGFNMAEIDGRVFVFVPNTDWSETTVFEFESDGPVHQRFTVPGLLNNWVKVR